MTRTSRTSNKKTTTHTHNDIFETPIGSPMHSVVTVPYSTLLDSPLSLTSEIGNVSCNLSMLFADQLSEEAFGSHPSTLGIIVVRDLPPEYPAYRERLLKLSYKFAHLDENVRESYSDSTSKYRFVHPSRSLGHH